VVVLERGGRIWRLLIARNRDRIEERALSAACTQSDIVIADRYLPRSCRPRWLKADRRMLQQSGGLALDLTNQRVTTVASSQGSHGWWRNERTANTAAKPTEPAGATLADDPNDSAKSQ
jgi:competence protein ComEC